MWILVFFFFLSHSWYFPDICAIQIDLESVKGKICSTKYIKGTPHEVSMIAFVITGPDGILSQISPPSPTPHPLFNTPSVPQGQDGKIKDTFGGRKAMNHQFTSSLHASHAKGQKWQTLPWLDLYSQEIWRVALPKQREAPSPRMPLAFCTVLYQSALHSLFPVYCDSLLLFL